ncbi:MAG: PHP domain-containing protein [Nitrospirae bacterium]|nr:PHP domain-containing protein [Nitrospirota bacterium]
MEMEFNIDMHVHSRGSGDSEADPEDMIKRAIEVGLNGIVFTEHYSYEASRPVERLMEKYRDAILVLRGVEFSAEEGHCLVYGVNTDTLLNKYSPVSEILHIVNECGGVVVPSHPYRGINSLGDTIKKMKGICAIEGHNGYNMQSLNNKAVEAAAALRLPYTGGSDSHDSSGVGSCYTQFMDRVTHDNFIELLKAGRYLGVDTRKMSSVSFPLSSGH